MLRTKNHNAIAMDTDDAQDHKEPARDRGGRRVYPNPPIR